LELWLGVGYDSQEIPVETVGMSLSSILSKSRELCQGQSQGAPIIFLDSPSQIFVSFCEGDHQLSISMIETHKKILYEAVNEAILSYRVAPLLSLFAENADAPFSSHLNDVFVEDSHEAVLGLNFGDWCSDIAEIVNGKFT
jgi:hypothetical protein